MKYTLFTLFFVMSSMVYADFNKCDYFFPNKRAPKVSVSDPTRELCFDSFAILYSVSKKSPVYCVEKLNYIRFNTKVKRKNNFHAEPMLAVNERSTPDDYKKSGYDKGHVCNAADQTNELAMEQSFSMSNQTPQVPNLNRKVWAKNVEEATRKYVKRSSGDIYVFTGQHYEKNHPTIGKNKVAVPSYVWKLVYDSQTKKSWVFWLPNTDDVKMAPPISYEEFVKRTGLKLLD